MIYSSSEYRKESKNAYILLKENKKRLLYFGILVALLAFATHFMLQSVTRSVLKDSFNQLMYPSYFSTLHTYVIAIFVFYILYIIQHYNYMTFAEVSMNKWYTLIKVGYNPIVMIAVKLFVRIKEAITFYTIGFIGVCILTMFLKYPIIIGYMLNLYLVGLIDILFLLVLVNCVSLFYSYKKQAKHFIVLFGIAIYALKYFSGFYEISRSINAMQKYNVLLNSTYILCFIVTCIMCIVLIFVRGNKLSAQTTFQYYEKDLDLEAGVKIVKYVDSTITQVQDKVFKKAKPMIWDKLFQYGLICCIVLGSVANIFVLVLSLSSPLKETNFLGVIPFVMHSETMEPQIKYNDLVFFENRKKDVAKNNVVLYRENSKAMIARVRDVNQETYRVDIDKYQGDIKKASYQKDISHDAVYGVYQGRSRWLGALVLFANTIFGRVLLLFIPAFMLYYYDNVLAYLRKKGIEIEA